MENNIKELAGRLLARYQEIERSIDLLSSVADYVSKNEAMDEVRSIMTEVKQIETELFPLRDQFLSSGQEFSSPTTQLFRQAAEMLTSLLPKINDLEQTAIQDRDKLAPEIHDSVRGMQMQSAYAQNR